MTTNPLRAATGRRPSPTFNAHFQRLAATRARPGGHPCTPSPSGGSGRRRGEAPLRSRSIRPPALRRPPGSNKAPRKRRRVGARERMEGAARPRKREREAARGMGLLNPPRPLASAILPQPPLTFRRGMRAE
ncbi:unnamed protein product, partial [Nesidiocoris tenuis]